MIPRPTRSVRHAARAWLLALAAGAWPTIGAATQPAADPLAELLAEPRAKLLILGTFHFQDAGLDDYQPRHAFDVLGPDRQREIEEVVERLAGFAPTKVAVEWPKSHQAETDERYRRYRRGDFELGPNEVYQLGFRLAARRGHQRVHLVDARGRRYQPPIDRDAVAAAYGPEARALLDSPWSARYERLHAHEDALKTRQTLREHLIYLNREDRLLLNHGQYLVGGFGLVRDDDYPGPDFLTGFWYSRNLRIFANVLSLVASPAERIVLIIGAGHVPILRHAAQASPEIELVEVADALR